MSENSEKCEEFEELNARIGELEKAVSERDEKLEDYSDHLKRLQAEFENYQKRSTKEKSEIMGCASERVIVKLLNIVDDFERAMNNLEIRDHKVKQGIEMIFKNLHKILDEEHVEEMSAHGVKFDPFKHEVLLTVESEEPEDQVLEELQKGYVMNGKVIRYAKVKISKGKGADKENEENADNENRNVDAEEN